MTSGIIKRKKITKHLQYGFYYQISSYERPLIVFVNLEHSWQTTSIQTYHSNNSKNYSFKK